MSTSEIGFTGTRKGMTDYQKRSMRAHLESMNPKYLHHGDCIGADEDVHNIARELGIEIVIHPPINASLRAFCDSVHNYAPLPYLERNKVIVRSSDLVIAAPNQKKEQLRSGTWSTIRYATKLEKQLIIIYPNED